MKAFAVEDQVEATLAYFGKPEDDFRIALHEHLIKRIIDKIGSLKEEINLWQENMVIPYEIFVEKIATDKQFVDKLNRENPMWEADLINWEFCLEKLNAWKQRLEDAVNGFL